MRDRHRRAVVLGLRNLVDRVAIGAGPMCQAPIVFGEQHAAAHGPVDALAELPHAADVRDAIARRLRHRHRARKCHQACSRQGQGRSYSRVRQVSP